MSTSTVMHAALMEAIGLGHDRTGPPHVLFALLDERRPSIAQDVLQALGVRRPAIEAEALKRYGCTRSAPDVREGVTTPDGVWHDASHRVTTPDMHWHETSGRAQAFAAVLGDGVVRPEHALLALAWEPHQRWFEDVLQAAGTSREAVVAGLAAQDVPVPGVALPALPPPKTQVATFPKAMVQQLNWALRERAGLDWGIGRELDDPEVMIVLAAAHVELSSILDDIVGQGLWHWREGAQGRTPA